MPSIVSISIISKNIIKRKMTQWWYASKIRLHAFLSGSRINGTVKIQAELTSTFKIGKKSSIGLGCLLIYGTDERNGSSGSLEIGHNCAVNEYCNIRPAGGRICIGNNVLIAQFVSIIATNHQIALGKNIREQPWSTVKSSVTLEDDVWIGAGAVILPGAHIGCGSVIGANSVVTGRIPSNQIWGGVPAKLIRKR